MQISIPLNRLSLEVRDGLATFDSEASATLAKFVLDEIEREISTDDNSTAFSLLRNRETIQMAATIATDLASLDRIASMVQLDDSQLAVLDVCGASQYKWVRDTAKSVRYTDSLGRKQDATAADSMAKELDAIAQRGPTDADHARLNYLRSISVGANRDKAGELLIRLSGATR